MKAYDLLRPEIRKFIYDEGWKELRGIQNTAIKQVATTNHNLILAAPTASGKTEAAFLPAINSIDTWHPGVRILYISPLIALINDQFTRVMKLCSYLDVEVTRWHGEANVSAKQSLIKNPQGIVLITPESLESLLTLKPYEVRKMFSNLEYVIVDEIHSFQNNNRGMQLQSLLYRLREYAKVDTRYIGMSATIHTDDYEYLKHYFPGTNETKILLDKNKNELDIKIHYMEEKLKNQASNAAIDYIYQLGKHDSMLVFPNSRKMVEYLSVTLNKEKEVFGGNMEIFAHHSSISKEMRKAAEEFSKRDRSNPFTIVCTSTLELGVDIGSVDKVIQYNAPLSVSSLGQRLGRSGRKTRVSKLDYIGTSPWDLLQGIAAIRLYERNEMDRHKRLVKPYDVVAHQILATLMERSGVSIATLKNFNKTNPIARDITDEELSSLLNHLNKKGYIEVMGDEVIIGRNAEEFLRNGNFFAVFMVDKVEQVYYNQEYLGDVPSNNNFSVNDNIFLAGMVWRVIKVDTVNNKIYVDKAHDGKPPHYSNGDIYVTEELRQEMKQILLDKPKFDNPRIQDALNAIYDEGDVFWPMVGDELGHRTFQDTQVNTTLVFLLNFITESNDYSLWDEESLIYGPHIKRELLALKKQFPSTEEIKKYFIQHQELIQSYIGELKFGVLLPENLKIDYILNNIFNLEKTYNYLQTL